ncbi:PilZ domain-containing protein [Novosphingobium rhizovicinum]|uniref:PilZ domain-containing protein n=1 Tax=Novosphingobium rhizovicinum TaxID=3228928 RepID=A0ABV3RDD2_9SPHN
MKVAESDRYALASQEDRCAPRTSVSIPAALRPAGGRRLQTVIRDISLSGFSAVAISRIPSGTCCWLTLPELGTLKAQVIWWDKGRMGCAFEQLLDQPAFDKLVTRWIVGNSLPPSLQG